MNPAAIQGVNESEAKDDAKPKRDVLSLDQPAMSISNWMRQLLRDRIEERRAPQVLNEVSFEGVATYLGEGRCSNVIVMAGAGISTSAGLPDYRTPGSGMLTTDSGKEDGGDAIDVFSIDYFKKDPGPFFRRSKCFFEVPLKPTPCHYFIRLLHQKGVLLRHYTQNIDTLDRLAGLPKDKIVEAHGSYDTSHCLDCNHQYSFTWIKESVLSDRIPTCQQKGCQGVVKPDIVLYGESLPARFNDHVEQDFPKCDLLIIMGTSLAVQPFASLVSRVPITTPRLNINLNKGPTGTADLGAVFGEGLYIDVPGNLTDVFKQATCDDACFQLARLAGWGTELDDLVTKEHRRLQGQTKAGGQGRKIGKVTGPARPSPGVATGASTGKTMATPSRKPRR